MTKVFFRVTFSTHATYCLNYRVHVRTSSKPGGRKKDLIHFPTRLTTDFGGFGALADIFCSNGR